MKLIFHYRRDKESSWGWGEWLETDTGEVVNNAWVLETKPAKKTGEDEMVLIEILMKKSDTVQDPDKE